LKRIPNSFIVLIFIIISCATGETDKERHDLTLIIPGKSAEGFTLNEAASTGDNAIKIKTSVIPEAFVSVFGKREIQIAQFNQIIYLQYRYAIFTNNGIVTAIAGLSPANRVTYDAVKLTDGSDNFIINYGNSGLEIIKDGKHRIYNYKKLGIAIFDDNGDDSIDMYIVFQPEK